MSGYVLGRGGGGGMEYGVSQVISGSHDGSGSLILMIGAYLQL